MTHSNENTNQHDQPYTNPTEQDGTTIEHPAHIGHSTNLIGLIITRAQWQEKELAKVRTEAANKRRALRQLQEQHAALQKELKLFKKAVSYLLKQLENTP